MKALKLDKAILRLLLVVGLSSLSLIFPVFMWGKQCPGRLDPHTSQNFPSHYHGPPGTPGAPAGRLPIPHIRIRLQTVFLLSVCVSVLRSPTEAPGAVSHTSPLAPQHPTWGQAWSRPLVTGEYWERVRMLSQAGLKSNPCSAIS